MAITRDNDDVELVKSQKGKHSRKSSKSGSNRRRHTTKTKSIHKVDGSGSAHEHSVSHSHTVRGLLNVSPHAIDISELKINVNNPGDRFAEENK